MGNSSAHHILHLLQRPDLDDIPGRPGLEHGFLACKRIDPLPGLAPFLMCRSIRVVNSSKTEETCFLVNPVFPAISSRIVDLVIAVLAAWIFFAGPWFFVDAFFTAAFLGDFAAAIAFSFEVDKLIFQTFAEVEIL
jgi:hypothetical protein